MGQETREEKIILEDAFGELEDRRSRFLAVLHPVRTEEEAYAFLAGVKKQYWDARHHCFAYVLDGGRNVRCSDDGEPQGTAGRPILDVLTGTGLTGVICIVTRYFGGTLLGTGGLVRAYSGAAQDAVRNAALLTRREGVRFCIRTGYADLGKVQYLLGQKGIFIQESIFEEDVKIWVVAAGSEEASLRRDLEDATGARAAFSDPEPVAYAAGEKDLVILG